MVTKSIKAFETIINLIKGNLVAISNLEKISGSPVTGYAAQKLALRNTLIEFSTAILQSVAAYAVKTNNNVLLAKVKTSRSALTGMTYEALIEFISAAITVVNPIVDALEDYNVDAATITLWQANLSQLQDVNSNPKNQHAMQNSAKKDIQNLIHACMELLYNQADQIATQFKADNGTYFTEYKYNRKLIPLTRHTKLRVTVTNEINVPIAQVMIKQNGTENFVMTDLKGEASLRIEVKEGVDPLYNFTISKDGKSKETGLIEIKRGETVSRTFIMAPTGFVLPAPAVEKVMVEK